MKYIIECRDDNSFNVFSEIIPNNYDKEVRDMTSFCLQYLYSVLNTEHMTYNKTTRDLVKNTFSSFDFDPKDVKELSDLISRIGYQMNKVMMTYDNGIPKIWDEI